MKKILIIAGGTGGHIFPALVIARALQQQQIVIEWMGTEAGMEKQLVPSCFPLHFLPIKALRGKNLREKCLAPWHLSKAIFLAYFVMKKINPDVVLGMGGYASGPGGVAAWLLRKPLVIHEQNAVAGLTNRWLAKLATAVLSAFPQAFSKRIKTEVVGNPVRPAIYTVAAQKSVHDKQRSIQLLILGGSQGAAFINQLIARWIVSAVHYNTFLIWHQTGQRDFEAIQKQYADHPAMVYRVVPFIDDMAEAYAWADIVIARAGALTVSEIAAAGLPSILIPFPYAADDHQYANALFLAKNNAAVVFRESELTVEKLETCLQNLLSTENQLQTMADYARICAHPEAVEKILATCRSVAC